MASPRRTGYRRRLRRVLTAVAASLGALGCRGNVPESVVRGIVAGRTLPPASSVGVITKATVVAFWLKGADTIPARVRRQVQAEFRRSNQELAAYLSDTDVGVVATVNDTVLVRLASGGRRGGGVGGLAFPYRSEEPTPQLTSR